MSLHVGNTEISQLYLGSTEIAEAYLGSSKVYDNSALPYDAQVEYLQSSGTQWIDTGVYGYMNHTYEFEFQQINTSAYRIWGVTGQSSSTGYNMSLTYSSNNWSLRWESTSNTTHSVTLPAIDANKHKIRIVDGDVYFDNVSKGTSAGHDSSCVINYNIFLFTLNPADNTPSSNGKIKLYSYKDIDENGVLVRDFIPVRVGTTGYMYDQVSGELFGNAGTGSFTYGNDVTS